MAPRRARHDIAVEVDGEDVFHRQLIKSDAVRLHEKPRGIVGQPHRNMAAGKIVLTFGDEDFAGEDEFLLDVVVGHCKWRSWVSGAVRGIITPQDGWQDRQPSLLAKVQLPRRAAPLNAVSGPHVTRA